MDQKKLSHGNTVFVRNLPFTTTKKDLESIFSDIGPIKEAFVVRDKGETETCKGFGYVKFALRDDAETATKKTLQLEGRKLAVLLANRKVRKKETPKDDDDSEESSAKKPLREAGPKKVLPKKVLPKCTVVLSGMKQDVTETQINKLVSGLRHFVSLQYPAPSSASPAALVVFKYRNDAANAIKKLSKMQLQGNKLDATLQSEELFERKLSKKGRLIIRNLSFKCTEEDLRNMFMKYGKLTEVTIPKKEDGKMRGFAFVNLSEVPAAVKAMKELNGSQIHGRPVAVDWAIAQEKFKELMKEKPISPEPSSGDESHDDDSAASVSATSDSDTDTYTEQHKDGRTKSTKVSSVGKKVKVEEESDSGSATSDSDGESDEQIDMSEEDGEESGEHSIEQSDSDSEDVESEDEDGKNEAEFDDDSEEDSDEIEDEDETMVSGSEAGSSEEDEDGEETDSESDEESQKINKNKNQQKKMIRKSDADEERTLFIRNVSFDTEEEDLSEALSQYGEVLYCRLVIDKDTEHSRGVAFVKFKNKEDAASCLKAATDDEETGGISVDSRKLNVTYALSRDKATKLEDMKKDKTKGDKRNLYLAREGLIRPGTQAAEGLSPADLKKRMTVESTKRQKLKNPNIFISRTRLCIRNIPIRVSDVDLRKLCMRQAADRKVKVTECRIMRDMKSVNAQGVAKSRGYAFVNFNEHEHALQVLRSLNNNPDIYGDKKRLIVEFSLENRAALEAKEKRMQRSQTKQNKFGNKKTVQQPEKSKQGNKKEKPAVLDSKKVDQLVSEHQKKKGPKGLPSHWGPKVRHKVRGQPPSNKKKLGHGNQATQKAGQGQGQSSGVKRRTEEIEKSPKKKKRNRGVKEVTDSFDVLVAKYRKNLTTASRETKNKWYL